MVSPVAVGLWAGGSAFILSGVAWSIIRGKREPLAARGHSMPMMVSLVGLLYFNLLVYEEFVDTSPPRSVSCLTVNNVLVIVFIPAFLLPILICAYTLYYRFDYHDALLHDGPRSWHLRLRWTTRLHWQVLYYLVSIAFWVLVALLNLSPVTTVSVVLRSSTRPCTMALLPALACQLVGAAILIVLLLITLRRMTNFVAIKQELWVVLLLDLPLIIIYLLDAALEWTSMPSAYILALIIATCFIVLHVPSLLTHFHRFSPAHVLREHAGSTEISLGVRSRAVDFILATPLLCESFEKHLVDTWCSEALMFYKEALHFASVDHAQERAGLLAGIVAEYIRTDAPLEINIDGRTRQRIMEMQQRADISSDTLDDALIEVIRTLEHECLRQWERTAAFNDVVERVGMSKDSVFRALRDGK